MAALGEHGVTSIHDAISGEPDVSAVDDGVRRCAEASCDVVVGLAVEAHWTLRGNRRGRPERGAAVDYVEGVRRPVDLVLSLSRRFPMPPSPTTAGSGSEVTKNAVLRVPEAAVKRSMRSDLMIPRVALIDPDLSRVRRSRLGSRRARRPDSPCGGFVSRGAQPTTDRSPRRGGSVVYHAVERRAQGRPSERRREPRARQLLGGRRPGERGPRRSPRPRRAARWTLRDPARLRLRRHAGLHRTRERRGAAAP